MALDRQQGNHFSIVVRPDFDRRIATQIAKPRFRRGGDEPFDRNLAGQNRGIVNQIKMARLLRLLFAQPFERNADSFIRLRLSVRMSSSILSQCAYSPSLLSKPNHLISFVRTN